MIVSVELLPLPSLSHSFSGRSAEQPNVLVLFFFRSTVHNLLVFRAVKWPMFFCYFIVILSTRIFSRSAVPWTEKKKKKKRIVPTIISFIKWQMYLICAIKSRSVHVIKLADSPWWSDTQIVQFFVCWMPAANWSIASQDNNPSWSTIF